MTAKLDQKMPIEAVSCPHCSWGVARVGGAVSPWTDQALREHLRLRHGGPELTTARRRCVP